jgi:hypothetical protein
MCFSILAPPQRERRSPWHIKISSPGMNTSNMNGSVVDGHKVKRRKSWGSTYIRSDVGKQDAVSRTMQEGEHFGAAIGKRLKNWACSLRGSLLLENYEGTAAKPGSKESMVP